ASISPTVMAPSVISARAAVAAPATSNQPVRPISSTGDCSGASSSTSRARTPSTVMAMTLRRERVGVVLDEVVDARREGLDIGRFDGREHADAQLVAPQLAVAVGVDDAVGPQRR